MALGGCIWNTFLLLNCPYSTYLFRELQEPCDGLDDHLSWNTMFTVDPIDMNNVALKPSLVCFLPLARQA